MSAVDVRPAVDGDAAPVSRIVAEAIRDMYTPLLGEGAAELLAAEHCSLPRIRAEIGIPGGAPGWLGWLVADSGDGSLAGAAAGGVPCAGSGEIYVLCVAPARQRTGVGGSLLGALTSRQLRHGAALQYVSLPGPRSPAAFPFFARHGFTRCAPSADDPPGVARCLREL
ncbi:hypothetical protein GCM10009716_10570 [Streptomyces sodiiphilus]|uniref:N-acetyltransferase domain-containing protein n=1 Tax=Streptomyces sodiiphilus TaxID=226217 RepID=A0ABN2NTP7_9ACTN